jgi:hypothetical protein
LQKSRALAIFQEIPIYFPTEKRMDRVYGLVDQVHGGLGPHVNDSIKTRSMWATQSKIYA